jgi:hypothetical protein
MALRWIVLVASAVSAGGIHRNNSPGRMMVLCEIASGEPIWRRR